MKKVAFIAYSPDTAHSLFPLISHLRETCEVYLYAFHPYVSQLWGTTLFLRQDFSKIFTTHYDLILTGGHSHIAESAVLPIAKTFNTPIISIVGSSWSFENKFSSLPTHIICQDGEEKTKLVETGIPEDIIFPFGNPYYDRLEGWPNKKSSSTPYHVLCVSEPSDLFKESFYYLIKTKDNYPELFRHITFLFHPLDKDEDINWFRDFSKKEPQMTFSNFQSLIYHLLACDLVYSTSATIEFESQILEKPFVRYENPESLLSKLKTPSLHSPKPIVFGATQRCLQLISEILSLSISKRL